MEREPRAGVSGRYFVSPLCDQLRDVEHVVPAIQAIVRVGQKLTEAPKVAARSRSRASGQGVVPAE